MIQFRSTQLSKLIIHRVGNKTLDEGVTLSNKSIDLEKHEALTAILKNYFLSPFKTPVHYNFHHVSSLSLNEVYTTAMDMFTAKGNFNAKSRDLANILYEYSNHPKIKSGEVYVAYFEDCEINDEFVDAIGIFKSENTETFLKVYLDEKHYEVEHTDGINVNKLDKGCLIFNTAEKNGYNVVLVDNLGKGSEAQYWKDEFLKLKPLDDDFHQTKNYLQLAKDFVTEKLDDEFVMTKADKINFLNRSIEYFKENDDFNEKDFAKTVFDDTEVIKSFRNFKTEFENEHELSITGDFSISANAVKKQQRIFKSVLKLDKNFHIYIHGDKELIEKGVEKDGRKYYKIYYSDES